MSQDGGQPRRLPAVGDSPSFVGDSGAFCFAATRDSKLLAITATLEQPEKQAAIRGMTDVLRAQWAGTDDWFMYYQPTSRTLVAQRADLKTRSTVGPLRVLAADIPAPNGYPAFGASPSLAAFVVNPREARNDFVSRLTWVDRDGKVLGYLGDTRGYWYARISHDGGQVAANPDDDIWLLDAKPSAMPKRFTTEMDAKRAASWPVWSPHDDRLLGQVSGYAPVGISVRDYPLSNPAAGHEILPATEPSYVTDWSRDGRYLLMTTHFTLNADLAYYDFGEGQTKPFLSTAAYEDGGVLSPDGHWLAYMSNTSGAFEVYVSAFPSGGEEKRVSLAGGRHPRWRGSDGKELFFLAPDGSVMAAPVKYTPSLEIGTPARLFRMPMVDIIHGLNAPYDVAPDGSKFLVIVPVQSSPVPLTLVRNWKAFIER